MSVNPSGDPNTDTDSQNAHSPCNTSPVGVESLKNLLNQLEILSTVTPSLNSENKQVRVYNLCTSLAVTLRIQTSTRINFLKLARAILPIGEHIDINTIKETWGMVQKDIVHQQQVERIRLYERLKFEMQAFSLSKSTPTYTSYWNDREIWDLCVNLAVYAEITDVTQIIFLNFADMFNDDSTSTEIMEEWGKLSLLVHAFANANNNINSSILSLKLKDWSSKLVTAMKDLNSKKIQPPQPKKQMRDQSTQTKPHTTDQSTQTMSQMTDKHTQTDQKSVKIHKVNQDDTRNEHTGYYWDGYDWKKINHLPRAMHQTGAHHATRNPHNTPNVYPSHGSVWSSKGTFAVPNVNHQVRALPAQNHSGHVHVRYGTNNSVHRHNVQYYHVPGHPIRHTYPGYHTYSGNSNLYPNPTIPGQKYYENGGPDSGGPWVMHTQLSTEDLADPVDQVQPCHCTECACPDCDD